MITGRSFSHMPPWNMIRFHIVSICILGGLFYGIPVFASDDDWIFDDIFKAIGGEEAFIPEMEKIAQHASSLRNGTHCRFDSDYDEGGGAFVGRLHFSDGVDWAAKVSVNDERLLEGMTCAIKALEAVKLYCPNVRAPQVYGKNLNTTLIYYLMEWIDGKPEEDWAVEWWREFEKAEVRNKSGSGNISRWDVKLSEPLAAELNSFFYNLSTCPISAKTGTFGARE